MLDTIRRPGWAIATAVVLIVAAVFVGLGFWQLDRLEQRQALNAIQESRIAMEPQPLADLLGDDLIDLRSVEYRRVIVEGEFDPSEEVLIRSQVELGQAGFHVVTPLVLEEGRAVLVNRGWVPLVMDSPPVPSSPPEGNVSTEGWIHLTQIRPPLGAQEPTGDLEVLNRVDIDRIGQQMPYDLESVYVVAMGEGGDELPILVDTPDFTAEGSHLAYAIQWFGFALVGLVGFFFLLRRRAKEAESPGRQNQASQEGG